MPPHSVLQDELKYFNNNSDNIAAKLRKYIIVLGEIMSLTEKKYTQFIANYNLFFTSFNNSKALTPELKAYHKALKEQNQQKISEHRKDLEDIFRKEIKDILKTDQQGDCYKVYYSKNAKLEGVQDPAKNSCLLLSIATKFPKIAETLLDDAKKKLISEEYLNLINYKHPGDSSPWYINTPLTLAAKQGYYELGKRMTEDGTDVNEGAQYGIKPLSILLFAVALVDPERHNEILDWVKIILEKEAEINKQDELELKSEDYLKLGLESDDIDGYQLIPQPNNKIAIDLPLTISKRELNKLGDKYKKIATLEEIKQCYGSVVQNDYTPSAKIHVSFIWGEREVGQKIRNSCSIKKHFFNTLKGQEIKHAISSLLVGYNEVCEQKELVASISEMPLGETKVIDLNENIESELLGEKVLVVES